MADGLVVVTCKGSPGCTQTDRWPTVKTSKGEVTIAVHDYICLACWMAGWRSELFKPTYHLPEGQRGGPLLKSPCIAETALLHSPAA